VRDWAVRKVLIQENIPMIMAGHDLPGTPSGFFKEMPMIDESLLRKFE
jgi:hypothetical protein